MSTMAENIIAAWADNRPSMLEKSQYNSWQHHMLLSIRGKEYGKDLLDSVLNGPFTGNQLHRQPQDKELMMILLTKRRFVKNVI
ncbi:hypothetical protein Tco_0615340 [Tanacetum coccineum]